MAAHFVLQIPDGLAGEIPTPADIAKNALRDMAAVVALRQQPVQGFAGDLGHGVPERDFDRANRDRALAVAAGLLALHHAGENFFRVQVLAGRVQQRCRVGAQDTRDEALAHLRAAGVASGGIESKAGHRCAVAHTVGQYGNHRRGHLRKIEARIGKR